MQEYNSFMDALVAHGRGENGDFTLALEAAAEIDRLREQHTATLNTLCLWAQSQGFSTGHGETVGAILEEVNLGLDRLRAEKDEAFVRGFVEGGCWYAQHLSLAAEPEEMRAEARRRVDEAWIDGYMVAANKDYPGLNQEALKKEARRRLEERT